MKIRALASGAIDPSKQTAQSFPMVEKSDVEELEERRLCARCIGESYLKALVQKFGEQRSCDFCKAQKSRTFSLKKVADHVEAAFDNHYLRTSDQPDYEDMAIRLGDLDFERHGERVIEAIASAAEIEIEAATAVQQILSERRYDRDLAEMGEESPFDDDSYYARIAVADDHDFQDDWRRFEKSLKSEARFFRRTAAATLASVFDGIGDLTTRNGASVILDVGPDHAITHLFRARALQSRGRLAEALSRPDIQIGPPSSHLARAGRMNAKGVPVFYGATIWEIALAEVRPPSCLKWRTSSISPPRPWPNTWQTRRT